MIPQIRYLWKRRLSVGSIFLFLCRYLPFTSTLQIYQYVTTTDFEISHCRALLKASVCFVYLEILVTTLVLLTRAYAVWGGTKKIAYALSIYSAFMIASSSYSLSLYIRGIRSVVIHSTHGCHFEIGNSDVGIDFIIFLVTESLSLSFLLAKSILHARSLKHLQSSLSGHSVLTVMTQDGVGYYVCVMAITTANLIILKRATPSVTGFLYGVQGIVQNILCSRLFFHLRSLNGGIDVSPSENTITTSPQ
ncbi:hypothetical protein SCHPADRAFT_616480 [Schizopora paradoxa]|uniref:Uncharacterized protein n=1 Tax=Schizopora paradoxa TaxID=27342 RepID=A0A0H2RF83_9AGAM|nr:hypothetical protein SCHPADRAFT_616480 [Schizopora paradoxa]